MREMQRLANLANSRWLVGLPAVSAYILFPFFSALHGSREAEKTDVFPRRIWAERYTAARHDWTMGTFLYATIWRPVEGKLGKLGEKKKPVTILPHQRITSFPPPKNVYRLRKITVSFIYMRITLSYASCDIGFHQSLQWSCLGTGLTQPTSNVLYRTHFATWT